LDFRETKLETKLETNTLLPMKTKIYLLIFLFTSFALFSNAQKREKYDIMLASGTVKPVSNVDQLSTMRINSSEIVDGKYFRIIQFLEIPTDQEKLDLKSIGVNLYTYLPSHCYFATFDKNVDLSRLNTSGNIRALLPIVKEYKLDSKLKDNKFPQNSDIKNSLIDLTLSYFYGIPADVIAHELKSRIKRVEILSQDDVLKGIRVRVKGKYISAISDLPFIQYVEPIEKIVEENNSGTTLHRSNTINTKIPGGLQYDGTGVGVSVGDGGIFNEHVDFTGRSTGQSTSGPSHATHVAGTVGGAGNINPNYAGQAPGANLIATNGYADISSVAAATVLYNGANVMRVTNHSLGQGTTSNYTSDARISDLLVESLPSLYNVHSCGNSGSGWSTITGGYKAGKNAIATGNLDYKDLIASSSSRGPSSDGRIKPDICAKGSTVYSTMPGNAYGQMSGTSMASPGIAGCVAQLIHAYKSLNGGTDPKLGLLKGIMLNTADDLGNLGPDYIYGWGRINVRRAYNAIKNNTYASGSISQGGSNPHIITIPANTQAIKVMVYWADPAAAAGVSSALINDLDILLAGPSQNYSPWELNNSSPSSAAIKGLDKDNNMEQVFVASPAAGTYTLNVSGYLVPQGPQEYFMSYEILTDEVKLTYPIGGEAIVPGLSEVIRWDAYGSTGTFKVEYSADSGSTWTTVNASVAATLRYLNWTPPTTITGKALMRVTRGSSVSASEAKFHVIPVPSLLKVDWRCPASFQLSWNAVTGATAYEVYLLGQKYMMPQGTTTGTDFWVQSPNTAVTWASVRALASNGQVLGRRAFAIQVSTAISGCLTSVNNNVGNSPYSVSVFPNPMNSDATISLNLPEEESVSITLIDVLGKKVSVIVDNKKLPAGAHQFQLTESYAPGAYMVMVKGEKGISYEKIIVGGE